MSEKTPEIIKEVIEEVKEGYWVPKNIEEWATYVTTNAILKTWKDQQDQERKSNSKIAIQCKDFI